MATNLFRNESAPWCALLCLAACAALMACHADNLVGGPNADGGGSGGAGTGGASAGTGGAGTGGATASGSGGGSGGAQVGGSGGTGTGGAGTGGAPTTDASDTGSSTDAADSGRIGDAPSDVGGMPTGCEKCLKYKECCMASKPGVGGCGSLLDFCMSWPGPRATLDTDCMTMMEDQFVTPRKNLGAPIPAACQ